MTTYARFTPQLELSTTADYAINLLPSAAAEEFAVTNRTGPFTVSVPGGPTASTGIYLDGWDGAAIAAPVIAEYAAFEAHILNTGSDFIWVSWISLDDSSANSADSQFMVLLPGRSVTIYGRKMDNQYNSATFPGAINLQCQAGDSSTAEVQAVQLSTTVVKTALGWT
jgi:hypothetical protein